MFYGKLKAITFSFDDGVTQDIRLIEILDKYGMKGTFNLNSELLGVKSTAQIDGKIISHKKVNKAEVNEIYKNHEVAVHTLNHPNLTTLDEKEIIRQVEMDRRNLSELTGYEVLGMAYPRGGVNNDDRVANIIKNHTGVKYARTITSTYSFDMQENIYRFNPTIYHLDNERLFELGEKFIKLKPDTPKLFYIWGHSYENDIDDNWNKFEEFCRLMSNKEDIFYGTNKEVFCDKI